MCQAGRLHCAIPIGAVEETSRPGALSSLSGVPPFVLGTTRLRGTVTPVVDLGLVLTGKVSSKPSRLVSLRVGVGRRRVALAVDSVQGVLELELPETQTLPPLLAKAAHGLVRSLGEHDEELLAVLQGGNVLSPELWKQLAAFELGGTEQ